mmetsp:Transcript_21110/g.40193  ORF Transcript_21110/g.40193 Transcript_21110/m.40193 type:complete len:200 (-) Transcript_21110:183-782(-)
MPPPQSSESTPPVGGSCPPPPCLPAGRGCVCPRAPPPSPRSCTALVRARPGGRAGRGARTTRGTAAGGSGRARRRARYQPYPRRRPPPAQRWNCRAARGPRCPPPPGRRGGGADDSRDSWGLGWWWSCGSGSGEGAWMEIGSGRWSLLSQQTRAGLAAPPSELRTRSRTLAWQRRRSWCAPASLFWLRGWTRNWPRAWV